MYFQVVANFNRLIVKLGGKIIFQRITGQPKCIQFSIQQNVFNSIYTVRSEYK